MSILPIPVKARVPAPLWGVVALLVVGLLAWRSFAASTPTLLARAHAPVTGATFYDGSWYWLESAGKPDARLVRAGGGAGEIASGAPIQEFALGDGKIAWDSGAEKSWSISIASLDGGAKAAVWTGERQPHGLCIADRRVLWLEQEPPLVPDCGPLAPLGATTRLMSAPLDGGPAAAIGEIMEPVPGAVIGIHGGQAYVSARRGAIRSVTAFYRMPVGGGAPKRVAVEMGEQAGLLTRDGALYWTAASRESSEHERVVCVQRLLSGDRIETLREWLPYGGRLFETPRGIYYVDSEYDAAVWPHVDQKGLPDVSQPPTGFVALAIGGGDVLLSGAGAGKEIGIYRMAMP